MSDSFYSASWYRVADLKPKLRGHAQLGRHVYRGSVWYVLQDVASGKSHRFSPAAYRFIGLMDGERTVQQLWDEVGTESGVEAPTQDEVIRLLGQLHATDALICDVVPDSEELFRRFKKHDMQKLKQRFWSPLAVRFPLFDPERFLQRTYPWLSFLFSWVGALLWLSVVVTGAVLAASHWGNLTENVVDRALTPENLLVLWLVYPVVKALHELGHGYAVKHAGGEVHDIGIMLLVLVPVPYVDASSAWGVREKSQRMLIGAAGIAVELFLGSLALFVWLNVESGAVHAIAYNVMLISGVSTLLFNGNPLLKFDGYYVLSDAIEIPNLGVRSNQYLGYLIQRYLFGLTNAHSPAHSLGERFWFVLYGISAFIYRMFIMFVIILYIGGKFFTIGVLLAAWSITTQVLIPMGKHLSFLFNSPRLNRNRGRSLGASAIVGAIIVILLFAIPVPFWTRAEGVIWPSEQAQVRAGSEGFFVEQFSASGTRVERGEPLVKLRDPFLESRVALLEARWRELKSQQTYARATDRVQLALIREELATVTADLNRAREKNDELLIRSERDGHLILPKEQDAEGRFVRQGQLLGYVVEPEDFHTIRVVVSHDEVGLIHNNTRSVAVLSPDWNYRSYESQIIREVPGGTHKLPSAALGVKGGGRVILDPLANNDVTTIERVFEVDVSLPPEADSYFLGQRMQVRFDHGYMPLAMQAYRSLRQLFLRRFSV